MEGQPRAALFGHPSGDFEPLVQERTMAALEIRDAEAQLRRAPAVGARRTLGESNRDVWRFDAGRQGPITTNLL